ncbi:MAG: hypothetical protein Q7S06_02510 [Nanoarchaeota archaeon]|nr:hypothetical protein [Nanoarchaeota archaeon]
MSLTKRVLEKQGYFDEPLETRKCPKCGGIMKEQEQDYSGMTEGQQADYDAGFNRPFGCSECGEYGLFDVESVYEKEERELAWKDQEIDELVKITRVDPNSFENVIEHALRSKCFIEAISLIHNTIEAYLKKKIEDLTNNDKERLELLKKKFNPQYLRDYTTISYLLGIIDNPTYKSLLEFNEKRNKVIHELMTKPKDLETIRQIARRGRELQMKLSPLNLSSTDIANIMATFDRITQ